MKVGDLNAGMLLTPASGFRMLSLDSKLLKFMRWVSGDNRIEPMIYVGRKENTTPRGPHGSHRHFHEVVYMGKICHIDSFDFRYVESI